MSSDLLERRNETLGDVEYLSRSPSRVRILEALADAPLTTGELSGATGIPRATLGRILGELVDRRWIERTGPAYRATQVGAFVVGEFTGMLDRLHSIRVLDRAARWFPERAFGFDLRCLATATVVGTDRTDVMAPTTFLARQIGNSDRVTMVSHALLANCIEAGWRGVTGGRQQVQLVLAAPVVEAIEVDPTLSEQLHEMLETGRVEVARSDADVPYVYVVTDGDVNIVLLDDDGAPHAVVCSDDSEVLAWAEATAQDYRSTAEPLDAASFPR